MTLPAPDLLTLVAATNAALAVALLLPRRSRFPHLVGVGPTAADAAPWWLVRYRWWLSLLAGAAGLVFAPGVLALPACAMSAGWIWWIIGRAEPPGVRTEREQARRELVPLVSLIASALNAGAPPEHALAVACEAMPGAASRRLDVVRAQVALGSDPTHAWRSLAADEVLAPLARAITRAGRTGAPVAVTVNRLAEELAATSRAEVEDRARVVGVKAAVPLGVCLLPSFLLIGIVPVAAGLLDSLT